jgi:hypothetical protein
LTFLAKTARSSFNRQGWRATVGLSGPPYPSIPSGEVDFASKSQVTRNYCAAFPTKGP